MGNRGEEDDSSSSIWVGEDGNSSASPFLTPPTEAVAVFPSSDILAKSSSLYSVWYSGFRVASTRKSLRLCLTVCSGCLGCSTDLSTYVVCIYPIAERILMFRGGEGRKKSTWIKPPTVRCCEVMMVPHGYSRARKSDIHHSRTSVDIPRSRHGTLPLSSQGLESLHHYREGERVYHEFMNEVVYETLLTRRGSQQCEHDVP